MHILVKSLSIGIRFFVLELNNFVIININNLLITYLFKFVHASYA